MNTLELDLQNILSDRLQISWADVEAYCQRWQIVEFALFGSVLRDDFRPDSDVDTLVTFAADHRWNLFDVMEMQRELEAMFGRKVDLVQKNGLKNPYRRANILKTHRVVYAN